MALSAWLLTVSASVEAPPLEPGTDLLIGRALDDWFAGEDLYNDDARGQTRVADVAVNQTAICLVRLQNDDFMAHRFVLAASGIADGWTVAFYDAYEGGQDITSSVLTGGYTTALTQPWTEHEFRIEIRPNATAREHGPIALKITATAVGDPAKRDVVQAIVSALTPPASVGGGVYTTDADFALGESIGVEFRTVHDQLQLSRQSDTLPFIWVPNSNEGSVSKIDTRTGRELGRYRTGPFYGSPSRTTVDQQGACWVGNRYCGTVTKIGLLEAGQHADRNGNGTIETSQDVDGDGDITIDEVLPWGEDECVLYEVVLIPGYEGTFVPGAFTGEYVYDWGYPGPRGIAVDASGNVWIGAYGTQKYYYLDGETAMIERAIDVSPAGHSPYGAVIDSQGILWSSGHSSNHVLRLDPVDGSFLTIPVGHFVYGMGVDHTNHLFLSGWENKKLTRIDIAKGTIDWTVDGFFQSRGVAVTDDGDVWVANSEPGTVTRWSNDGVVKATITVGGGPTGVAVDNTGKVWVVNRADEYVKRIDPTRNAVDIEKAVVGTSHYGYSDMTGIIARNVTTRLGTWTVVHDSKTENASWGVLSWTASVPVQASLALRARSSPDLQKWSAWEVAVNGLELLSTPPGRYLQVQAILKAVPDKDSPVVYDIRLETVSPDRPRLRVTDAGNHAVAISWVAGPREFILQTADNLAPTAHWNAVTAPVLVVNGRKVVSISAGGSSQFFRLRSP